MKKLLVTMMFFASLFVAVVAVALWSCGGANTPSAVAEKAVKCIQKGDYEGYVDLMEVKNKDAKNIKEEKEQFAAMLREKGSKTIEKKQGIKSYEVVSEEISEDGNSATVKMKIVYGDGSEKDNDMKLVKTEDGDWKITMGK